MNQMQQELLVDFIMSLDGYGSAEGWPGWWGMQGSEYLAWLDQQPEDAYTLLMGANTYRQFSEFASAATEPGDDTPPEEAETFEGLAATPKILFSSTIEQPSMPNTRIMRDDAAEAVARLKQEPGPGLRTVGSLTLCRSLLAAGLVDRLRVVVFPVITGATGQERIFDGFPDVTLELLDARLFDGRLQMLDYRPSTPVPR